jgi:uncharacterized protein YcgI (DUF1989 family)
VTNLFQVTGLDEKGRYFMNPCPTESGDYIEFLAEQDLLMALSRPPLRSRSLLRDHDPNGVLCLEFGWLYPGTCPGGDLSRWRFASGEDMTDCCRPLRVEVFKLADDAFLANSGWKPAQVSPYRGMHGLIIAEGETQANKKT